MHEHLTLIKGISRPSDSFFLRAESFYNVASNVDELRVSDHYGGTSLHEQSHGESFMSLMLHRFFGKGLYLLDEPEAALSPARQFALIARIGELVRDHSQFIIATHSPILMAYPDAEIYLFNDDGIAKTSYEKTDHYILTKQFLNDPSRILNYLLDTRDDI